MPPLPWGEGWGEGLLTLVCPCPLTPALSPTGRGSAHCLVACASVLEQTALRGDAAEVVVGVAEGRLDHGQPLEVVADLVLHGHADAAVQLDRLLADVFRGASHLH